MNRPVNYILLLFIFTGEIKSSFSQNEKPDSLWSIYNSKTLTDTTRLNAINIIAKSYIGNNPDTAIILGEQELKFANSLPGGRGRKWAGKSLNIIGISYMNKSNYPKALESCLKALKFFVEIGDKRGMANCYNNIGIVYKEQSDYQKALEYHFKALWINKEMSDKRGMGNCYTNMGIIYKQQSCYSKALEFQLNALKMFQDIGEKRGVAACYINVANVYDKQAKTLMALEYYLKSLKINQEINDKSGLVTCYYNLGRLYNNVSNNKFAMLYSDSCLRLSRKIGAIDNERLAYWNLSVAYSKTGNYKEAYESHVKYKQLTDSIFNEENSRQLGDMKTRFEVEKKEAELKAKAEAQQAITNEEKKRQQFVIYTVAGILCIVVMFSVFLLNRFRVTQKQKKVIEQQKILVDEAFDKLHERNKEVIDSINYARRIQTALLTSEKYIARNLERLNP